MQPPPCTPPGPDDIRYLRLLIDLLMELELRPVYALPTLKSNIPSAAA